MSASVATAESIRSAAIEVRAVTRPPRHHFFGYYDKCPWDGTGKRLLVHEVAFNDRAPGAEDEATVAVVELERGNRLVPFGRTHAWNFQQGAMLQWVGPDYARRVAYNRRDGERFVAVLADLEAGTERVLDRPIGALSRDGSKALCLNFARLADARPGYGYAGSRDPWADVAAPEDDGIHLLDLATGDSRLVVSLAEAAEAGERPPPRGAKQWFNHVLFNPSGTRFCFLQRWRENGSLQTRLFTARVDGSDLYCLSEAGMVSHFDWRNDEQLLAWARVSPASGGGRASVARLAGRQWLKRPPLSWGVHLARRAGVVAWTRRKVLGDRFQLFTDRTREAEPVGLGELAEDYHCSYSPNGRFVLLDGYPHEDGKRELCVYDTQDERRIELARLVSMPELTAEIRCDLHSRWDRTGARVCIDSTHEGTRQVYVVEPLPLS